MRKNFAIRWALSLALAGAPLFARAGANQLKGAGASAWQAYLGARPSLLKAVGLPRDSVSALSRVLGSSGRSPSELSGQKNQDKMVRAITAKVGQSLLALPQLPSEAASWDEARREAYLAAALAEREVRLEALDPVASLATLEPQALERARREGRARLEALEAKLASESGSLAEARRLLASLSKSGWDEALGVFAREWGGLKPAAGLSPAVAQVPAQRQTPPAPAPQGQAPAAEDPLEQGMSAWLKGAMELAERVFSPSQASGSVLRAVPTMITLDYRASAWNLERISLDGISNHLPHDSGGTRAWVRLKQVGAWRSLEEADPKAETEEIIFADDGVGYDWGLLAFLYSTKRDQPQNVGQFGEGLKMIAAAALREGIALEYRSRDWSAVPVASAETVASQAVRRLNFKVEAGLPTIHGSRTLFSRPPPAFVEEVLRLPAKVLAFNRAYQVLEAEAPQPDRYASRVIGLRDGQEPGLFIKGVRLPLSGVTMEKLILSYDLGVENISPDRQAGEARALTQALRRLLRGLRRQHVLSEILRGAEAQPSARFLEATALDPSLYAGEAQAPEPGTPEAKSWTAAFYAAFGRKAILPGWDTNLDREAELLGYRLVHLPGGFKRYLERLGVPDVHSLRRGWEAVYVEAGELTGAEKAILALAPTIEEAVLGQRRGIPLRVYSAIRLPNGELGEAITGFHAGGKQAGFIAVKRSSLRSVEAFLDTFVHELGHWETGRGDYDREFVNFFTLAIARLLSRGLPASGVSGAGM